jgi:hypothetical protein
MGRWGENGEETQIGRRAKLGKKEVAPNFIVPHRMMGCTRRMDKKKEEAEKEDDADADGRMTLRRRMKRRRRMPLSLGRMGKFDGKFEGKLGSNDVKQNIPSCV